MTDESEEPRKKLRLSRNTNADNATPESKASEPAENDQAKPKLSMPKPEAAQSLDGNTKESKQKLTITKSHLPTGETEKSQSPPPPVAAPSPTGATPGTPTAPPPIPTTTQATPAPTTPESIDQDLERLETKQEDNSTLISVIIIIVLFVILSAAAGGIFWWIMRASADESQPEEAATHQDISAPQEPVTHEDISVPQDTPDTPPSISNAVQRAKAVIATVPSAEASEVINDDAIFEVVTKVTQPAQQSRTSSPPPPKTTAPVGKQQQETTDYLAGIHIDGVRSGPNPKVMIDGESYLVGDEINEEIGLSFSGIQDGRLLFKDRSGIYYLKSF